MQFDDSRTDVVATEDGSKRAGAPYQAPDVDTVVPAMIPQLMGTTICSSPESMNDPDCDAT